jgi:hypothetical protein
LVSAKPSFHKAYLYVVAGFYSSLLNMGNENNYWEKVIDSEFGINDPVELKNKKEYLENILKELKSGEYKEKYYR